MSTSEPAIAPEQLGIDTLAQFVRSALDGIVVIDHAGQLRYANPAACDILGYALETLIGQEFRSFVPVRLRPSMDATFAAGTQGVGGRFASALVQPDGAELEIECSSMHFEIDSETIHVVIFEDVTALNRQAREAAILTEISSAMTVNLSMEDTVEALAAGVVTATDAVASMLLVIDVESGRFRFAGLHNLPDAFRINLTVRWPLPPESITAAAFATGEHQLRRNARNLFLANPTLQPLHAHIRDAAWDTQVVTPMSYRGTPTGVLVTFYLEDWVVCEDDLQFLRTVADQAAVTITNTQLFQEARSKAALQERQRLSRELHDSVSQALYGISLGAATALRLLGQNPEAAREPVDYVLSLADAGLAEMRALIFDLMPESLETEGLVAALEKQAAYLQARHRIRVNTDLGHEPELPLETREAIYRIAQEALLNTVRHARATEVWLCLEGAESGVLTMHLHDNGVGFDPEVSSSGNHGLQAMRESAARLGGTIVIESAPGQGTRARLDIPLNQPGAQATRNP